MHVRIGPELPVKVSPATRSGNHIFATNIPVDLASGAFVGGAMDVQAKQTFENLVAFVEEAGGAKEDIAQITIYITDSADFKAVAKAYDDVFDTAPYPTRATVVVKELIGPPGMLVETTAHAVLPAK